MKAKLRRSKRLRTGFLSSNGSINASQQHIPRHRSVTCLGQRRSATLIWLISADVPGATVIFQERNIVVAGADDRIGRSVVSLLPLPAPPPHPTHLHALLSFCL